MIELVSSPSIGAFVSGLAAILLGECVIYNKSVDDSASTVVDAISQRVGLTAYFRKIKELKQSSIFVSAASRIRSSKPLARSTILETDHSNDMTDEDHGRKAADNSKLDHPYLYMVFDPAFVNIVNQLEPTIRESTVHALSHPKNKVGIVPAVLEQKAGENDKDYIARLKSFMEKQCSEMQVCTL